MLSAVCIPATRIQCFIQYTEIKFPVVIERGSHPFPFRTRQLSLSSPMILRGQLCGKVGRRRDKIYEGPRGDSRAFSFIATGRARRARNRAAEKSHPSNTTLPEIPAAGDSRGSV